MTQLFKTSLLASCAMLMMGAAQGNPVIKDYFEFKKPKMIAIPGDISLDANGAALPSFSGGYSAPGVRVLAAFEGVSQYDAAAFGRNAIPPDTMGVIGKTQFMETTNGAYAIFDKATGVRTSLVSDTAFWAAAGQTGTQGDSRVMYNAVSQRWIAISFGQSVADIQIAVSTTSDALGPWQSTKFTGFAGGTADYPTLALDRNAVYIGTNNFTTSFKGTTMNVIPLDSLFGVGAPTTSNMKQFVTPYTGLATDVDRGYAIQGVNSSSLSSSGKVVSVSLFDFDNLSYKINGLTSTSALGASLGAVSMMGESAYTTPGKARQPSAAIAANRRIVDAGDDRIGSSVFEANGRIYGVHTVNPTADGQDAARVRYFVLDATTMALLAEGDLGEAGYDYYMPSLAVNSKGHVVIAYNRSGLDAATGKISIMAQTFTTAADGHLVKFGSEVLLKESLTDDYHNGSLFGFASAGRQRWGDYSAVSIDPDDESNFWIIGEFAREYNNAAGGHPGGTGGSRWGTWISELDFDPVPEPSTLALMLLGLGFIGHTSRQRQRRGAALVA